MKIFVLLFCLCFLTTPLYAEQNAVPINLTGDLQMTEPLSTPPIAPVIEEEDLNFEENTDAFGNALNQNPETQIPQPGSLVSDHTSDSVEKVKVDTRRSLTDNIRSNAPPDLPELEVPDKPTTWVNQLLTSAKKDKPQQDTQNPLATMLEQSQNQNRRSNASIFDISGVMLRMSYKQAEEALTKRGYKKTMQKMDIPNFIRWRNEDKCRNQGVIGYERLNNCVIKIAQKEKNQFIAQAQFSKYDTKETVQIFLTSTFTNNKVYKITYRSEAANNAGNSPKAIYLRNIKVYDFWKKINQKYGAPDNKDDVIWSLGGNKPYMKAATGYLLLEDPMLRELDYTRMSREDQRFMNTDLYTF